MSDLFDPQEALRLQRLLIQKEQASSNAKDSLEQQRSLAAGSVRRDHQGRQSNQAIDHLGNLTDELRQAGVIDGMGALTDKALASGIRSGRLPDGSLRVSYEFDPRLPT